MAESVHLVIERGEEKGRQITVPPRGARLGRSSKNDIVILDPLLSRHHCRLFFKPGEGLWASDLGSANQTLVNDKGIQETRVHVGDSITVGDTILRVVSDGMQPASATGSTQGRPVVDLGLDETAHAASTRRPMIGTWPLIVIAFAVIAVAIAVWAPRLIQKAEPPPPPPEPPPEPSLEITYEKVQADTENVFRYHLRVSDEKTISVQIDDVENHRHVRKEKGLAPEYVMDLIRYIEDSGFFLLEDSYQGIQPNVLESWDLEITIGRRTHRTTVINRIEPEVFQDVRERIEEAGKNELGLWAIQFSPEKLRAMARDAYLQGRKMYDEREVRYGNLADAIKSLHEADWYLETIEPKPDFFPELVSLLANCERLLNQKFEDQSFRAERAIKLRDWSQAAVELRILLEMLPDRDDERNEKARRKLLDVESRMQSERN